MKEPFHRWFTLILNKGLHKDFHVIKRFSYLFLKRSQLFRWRFPFALCVIRMNSLSKEQRANSKRAKRKIMMIRVESNERDVEYLRWARAAAAAAAAATTTAATAATVAVDVTGGRRPLLQVALLHLRERTPFVDKKLQIKRRDSRQIH
jgi:hypothetical protein